MSMLGPHFEVLVNTIFSACGDGDGVSGECEVVVGCSLVQKPLIRLIDCAVGFAFLRVGMVFVQRRE